MSQQVIICVDDESIVLESLKEQLQKEFGDELLIEIAGGGQEALEVYDELIEDGMEVPAVIVDFIMPEMKGDKLLEKIHSKSPETRKIMLTGQASVEGVSNAVNNANLYRYISKPWDKADLILTLREAVKSYKQSRTIYKQNVELRELNSNLESKVEERTKELKELNATKDKFFSIIAHDLKNPFNTLMGFSELIIDNYSMYEAEQIKDYINIIFETARNSYTLLENLLHWSRSQTGRLQIEPNMIDIPKLVLENVLLLENQASKKDITLQSNIDTILLAYADMNIVHTVLRNLVSNAIKYTNSKGTVTISAKQKNSEVIICVEDTGVGIKPKTLEVLFRIDQGVSTKGTADEVGTGLGLILCKEFVEKSGGRIWVESEVGQGSKFYFSLPVFKE